LLVSAPGYEGRVHTLNSSPYGMSDLPSPFAAFGGRELPNARFSPLPPRDNWRASLDVALGLHCAHFSFVICASGSGAVSLSIHIRGKCAERAHDEFVHLQRIKAGTVSHFALCALLRERKRFKERKRNKTMKLKTHVKAGGPWPER